MAANIEKSFAQSVPVTIHEDANIYLWQKPYDISARVIAAIWLAVKQYPIFSHTYSSTTDTFHVNSCNSIGLAISNVTGLHVANLSLDNSDCINSIRDKINLVKDMQHKERLDAGSGVVMSNIGMIAGKYATPIIPDKALLIVAIGKRKIPCVL